jgi:hypothetical protein
MGLLTSTLLLLAVIVGMVAFSLAIGALGYIPDIVERLRGKPRRVWSNAEQLHIDLLRSRGYTRRAAIKAVEAIAEIRDGKDMLFSPLREGEAIAVSEKLQADFVAGRLPPELAKAYAKALNKTSSP